MNGVPGWEGTGCWRLIAGAWFVCLPLGVAATEPVERPIDPVERLHWAFQPLSRPSVPHPPEGLAAAHPIDAFLQARLHAAGLRALPTADRATLLRRATFDLTGLPPTPEELDAFLGDATPDAWERVVDRLLASPAYGERWAQHWLDLARFAETDGFEHDLPRPQAWRYRDWVIAALNDDLPLDLFLQWQIAGDLLAPDDPRALIATGFLLCGPDMPDINNQDERRHVLLNELTAAVGEVYLGLQVGCAQCHDHKVDPISQLDFYRLRAFFEAGDIFQDHVIATPAERAADQQLRAQRGALAGPLEGELKRLEDTARQRLRDQNPDLPPTADNLRGVLTAEEQALQHTLKQQLARLPPVPDLPKGRVFREGSSRPAHWYARGDFRRPMAEVAPAFPRIADLPGLSPGDGGPAKLRSRRELAFWLTDPHHPLVPRVLVNRIWQFHFGHGLVRTPSDFGFNGGEPTHPELLDWLAAELPRRQWSLKALHRLIVTSAAYQRSARPAANVDEVWSQLVAADPENRLWGRREPLRLDGESLRDALLAVSGRLSDRQGGPGVRPPLPAELVSTLLKNQWTVSPNVEDHHRRSIYLFVRRNLRYPLFEAFDRPDTNHSCPQRSRSTVAPQALVLMNGELAADLAKALADRLQADHPAAPEVQIASAYRRCLGRFPTPSEKERAAVFVQQEGLASFCLALFNLNEFLYID
uniref:DUF1553 domain-containing protein n=1 Tax=Schlesneria paludicola TaxID=360056 RepID=A0A7C4LIX9_9PLAN